MRTPKTKHVRWLIVPVIFIVVIVVFVQFSINLDDTKRKFAEEPKTNLGLDLSAINIKGKPNSNPQSDNQNNNNNNEAALKETVTVTVKETVTYIPESPNFADEKPKPPTQSEKESRFLCDPYNQPGYFNLYPANDQGKDNINKKLAITPGSTSFISLNPQCKVSSPSLLSLMKAKLSGGSKKLFKKDAGQAVTDENLKNKKVVMFGDGFDRDQVVHMCSGIGGRLSITELDNMNKVYKVKGEEKKDLFLTNGLNPVLPRRCEFEKYGLSISNFYLFGLSSVLMAQANEEQEIAEMLENSILQINSKKKQERIDFIEYYKSHLFSWKDLLPKYMSAIESVYPEKNVDVVFINFGIADLIFYGYLSSKQALNKVSHRISGTKSLPDDQINHFKNNLSEFISELKKQFPASTRFIYRELQYVPYSDFWTSRASSQAWKDATSFYSSSSSNGGMVLSPHKVNQLNQIAKAVSTEKEIEFWPIGSLTRDLPPRMIWDDQSTTTTRDAALSLWGEGILEYIARTPSA